MRITLLLAFITLLFSFTTMNDNVTDRLGVKGPLQFNNTSFGLAWSDHPRDNYYIQEYLPAGETPESFTQMLTIHLFDTDLTPKEAVKIKENELKDRQETDPGCNYQILESPDGKEFIVDFLLSESKGDEMAIAEFNVYRYKEIDLGNNKSGLIVYAYTKRSYGEGINGFLTTLKDDRAAFLNEVSIVDIPEVTVAGK